MSATNKWLTLTATVLGSAMVLLDSTIVNIALPAMQRALQADAATTQWIVNAYLLLLGPLVLIGGSAADLYGRRRVFVLGIAIFATASAVAGLSPSAPILIACRAAQGFGGALLSPASLAILQSTFGENERSRAIGIWAGAGALMMVVGPALGGWLVDHISWRAIFLINIPLACVAAGLVIRFGAESRSPDAKPLDWGGAASVAIGLGALTWSLSAIPASGFHNARLFYVLGAAVFFLALFLIIETRLRERAMMPLSLFRSRNFSTLNAQTLLLYFAVSGTLYYLPFGFIRLGGYSATQAGAALSPLGLIIGFGAPLIGAMANRLNSRLLLVAGPLIVAFGLAILAFVDFKQRYLLSAFPPMILIGLGMAMTVPPLTSNVLKAAGKDHAGIASGVNNAVARVAGLLAVASLGAVFFASFSFHLSGLAPGDAIGALNAVMRGEPGVHQDAITAFARALHTVMLVPASFAVLAGLAGWLWKEADDAREGK